MSILINMEMPNKKNGAVLIIYPDGKCAYEDGKTYQAVPIPPHGRLIDADALRQSIGESIDECHKWADEVESGEMYARVSQSLGTFVECSLRVKAAPTIIPADPEEEGET